MLASLRDEDLEIGRRKKKSIMKRKEKKEKSAGGFALHHLGEAGGRRVGPLKDL